LNNANGTITVGGNGNAVHYSFDSTMYPSSLKIVSVTIGITATVVGSMINIILGDSDLNGLKVGVDFIAGDEYDVQIFTPSINNPICSNPNNTNVTFIRGVPPSEIIRNKVFSLSKKVGQPNQMMVQVPTIALTSQTLIDGSDMGDIIFTIGDQFTYYSTKPLTGTTCADYFIPEDQIQNTVFRQYCPKMVTVVKGKGSTLYDKLLFIYNGMSAEIGPSFADFYQNIIIYGMVRYFLSRVLYGNFDINYLLGKYYQKFLNDLNNTRFCWIVDFFFLNPENPTYNYGQFFKFGPKKLH
jgi:hypothetical protein